MTFPEGPITFKPLISTLPPETSPGIPISINPLLISSRAVTSTEEITTPITTQIITKTTEPAIATSQLQPITTVVTSEAPETSQSIEIPVPGFGPLEAIIAIFGLLVYTRRRSKR